tara:strand:+ start:438 stop:668 length:231 start_codon:yes stop_codon:yes gene_type:complete
MNQIYQKYLLNMRNLVSVYLDNYKCNEFDDEYKEANEFLLNYSFGKYDRGETVMLLEQKYMDSIEQLININLSNKI